LFPAFFHFSSRHINNADFIIAAYEPKAIDFFTIFENSPYLSISKPFLPTTSRRPFHIILLFPFIRLYHYNTPPDKVLPCRVGYCIILFKIFKRFLNKAPEARGFYRNKI
jgi:hypothetical protein